MKASEKLIEILKHLKISANKFSVEIGLENNTKIYHLKNDRNDISPEMANIIIKRYPELNYNWLITGVGEMLNEQAEEDNYIELREVINKKGVGVPYYDVDFTASFLEVQNNQNTNPDHYINHPFFRGCDYVVRASGQSMAKVIAHGDAIGLVELKNWRDFFPFGEIYAIVTKDNYRMIKVITKGETEDTYTLISKPSYNKRDEFPPQQIKKDLILHLFKVQASSHLF